MFDGWKRTINGAAWRLVDFCAWEGALSVVGEKLGYGILWRGAAVLEVLILASDHSVDLVRETYSVVRIEAARVVRELAAG